MPKNTDSPLASTDWLAAGRNGALISVHAQPGAKRTAFAGLYGNCLKIALASPPVDGKANALLLKFLAEQLGVAKSRLTLVRGETSRSKQVLAAGLTPQDVIARLGRAL